MMETTEEWKSLWPISSVYSPPLLISPGTNKTKTDDDDDTDKKIGPLIFTPSSHRHLLASPSFSPHIPPPFPSISFPRFLQTTSSSIVPSTATSVSNKLSSSVSIPDRLLVHNSLQLMRCPGTNLTLAFFPSADRVGFVVLSVVDSHLTVTGDCTSQNALVQRIVKISVIQLPDCECTKGDSTIGYLLVNTAYSVHYYKVIARKKRSDRIIPRLELVGNKVFKSSGVVNACWSPHIPEESLVLLENGDMYIYDLDSCSGPLVSSQELVGKKLQVVWDMSTVSESGGWLSCDFSWHPKVLIVVHSSVVFLVDLRGDKSKVTTLLKIGAEHVPNDRFLAFSVAAPDRFYFTLASTHMLFLCDVRKPMIPVIRWAHNIDNPSNIMVSRLSDLRSHCVDVTYNWASEEGFGILLGSLWKGESSLFCYGPDVKESTSSPVTGSSKSFYAWGLPSNLSLVTNECCCGSCLVKEEFCKDKLANWIDWQQKKEFVLGFGILDKEISSKLLNPDAFGGFTLVTLTSSGNLESHKYCASWNSSQASGKGHIEQAVNLQGSVLYETGEEEYKFKKTFFYFKFSWLDGYLKSDLARVLSIELVKDLDNGSHGKASVGDDFHEKICQKLNTFGSTGPLKMNDVFKDISLPTSIHEIALRSVWTNLPKTVLRFGFCMYSDLPKVLGNSRNIPCEFLEIPCEQPHLPPFFCRFPSSRSSKWSDKHTPSISLVGPVIPIPFLMALHKTRLLKADNVPADTEIDLECDEVMKAANEVTSLESCFEHAVSLADDDDDVFPSSKNEQQFASYKPVACSSKSSVVDLVMEDSVFEDEKHSNLIFKVGQKDVKQIFDSHCSLKFKIDEETTNFGPTQMKSFKLLKRQFSNFKDGFSSYQG